jgi:signal transduction histidine kinase/CHASE3 domain sensor protein/ActR/RegA family two-component response regulator
MQLAFGQLWMLVCAGLLTAVVTILSFRDGMNRAQLRDQQAMSQQNVLYASSLLSALRAAETGQRGYILTHRDYYLVPYREAIRSVPAILDQLMGSAASRSDQERRVRTLAPLITLKLAELDMTIGLYTSGHEQEALGVVMTDEGKNTMDDISRILTEIGTVANRRVNEQTRQADDSARHTLYLSVITGIVLMLMLGWGTFTINRSAIQLRFSEGRAQARLARLELLSQITRALGDHLDLRSIFQAVVLSLEEHLPADFGFVCLYETEGKKLIIADTGVGMKALGQTLINQLVLAIDENGLARCMRGDLVYEPDVRQVNYDLPQILAEAGLYSVVMAPLVLRKDVFGALILARSRTEAFDSRECEFLRQLGEHLALAVHQSQILESLQKAYDDLTETQQIMSEQERLRALGQMASGVAHDINNALSPITMYTDDLLDKEPGMSENVLAYLDVVRHSAGVAVETVTRLAQFARQRDHNPATVPVRLDEIARQVLDMTRAKWNDIPLRRGIVIEAAVESEPDIPAISGVESDLREALINLVFNAVDAMPEGGHLVINVWGENTSVYVEVRDSGIGMNEETRQRAMEPFFTTKGPQGTGLGLAMVFGIVKRHNGTLHIYSAPGDGTRVRLSFPITARKPALENMEEVPPPMRILIIDDDPMILNVLKRVLQGDGHTVVTASSGQEGMNLFRKHEAEEPFGAVFTDLGMPNMDGRKVATAIREIRRSVKIVLLTGWGQRISDDEGTPDDIDLVVGKPPQLATLRAALNDLIKENEA